MKANRIPAFYRKNIQIMANYSVHTNASYSGRKIMDIYKEFELKTDKEKQEYLKRVSYKVARSVVGHLKDGEGCPWIQEQRPDFKPLKEACLKACKKSLDAFLEKCRLININ